MHLALGRHLGLFNPEEVPPIMASEVEAALRKIKNVKEARIYQVNIETLKAGDETIMARKKLAMLFTECITETSLLNMEGSK